MTEALRGHITVFLDSLGLRQGDPAILDALVLVNLPTESTGFLRDDGTTADYLVSMPSGAEFKFINDELSSILLRTVPDGDYGAYPWPDALIAGLSMPAKCDDVRAVLGEPENGRATWDRFDVDGRFVHFQYSAEGLTEMVTVMSTAP